MRSLLAQYDALGRVRVGRDGVNGQVVVDHDAVEAVQKGLESIKELSGGITLSVEPPLPVPKPQCADEESALQHMPRYWVPEKYKKHRARITQRSVAFDSLSVSAKSSIINLSVRGHAAVLRDVLLIGANRGSRMSNCPLTSAANLSNQLNGTQC